MNATKVAAGAPRNDDGIALQADRMTVPARGSAGSRGGPGSWTGFYRLERFSCEYGQLTATGIFTGHLADAGSSMASSSGRHTCAVTGTADTTSFDFLLGPLDVKLSGLLVRMEELHLLISLKALRQGHHVIAPGLLAALMEAEDLDPSIVLWLSRSFAAPASIDRPLLRTGAASGRVATS
jgi:hypothetical protein